MSEMESSDGKPNLTPILDMVFQLITFFMLVINFKAASLDRNLRLPVVGSARAVESFGKVDILILNISKDGRLMIYGFEKDVEAYIATEAAAARLAARRQNAEFDPATSDLPTRVVIRADRQTPFTMVNKVLRACQDHGFRDFALKAMNK
jgi:biopolymer transport protein ExbD